MSQFPGSNPPPYHEISSQIAPPPYQPALYPALPSRSTHAHHQVPLNSPRMAEGFPPYPPSYQPNPEYIASNINHREFSNQETNVAARQDAHKSPGDFSWVLATPSTAFDLRDQAVIGGYEGGGSPLWVIRAKHKGMWIPGKLSVRTNVASVAFFGKEVCVQAFEVLCARSENLQWVPANRGNVPPNAVVGGKTMLGMILYVGRARFQRTLTPGNVFPWKKCCNIGFGREMLSLPTYEVLCRIR